MYEQMYEQISESRENGYMIEMVSLVARKKYTSLLIMIKNLN